MTKAYTSAIRLLARREYGAKELYTKLLSKGLNPKEVEEALVTCQRQGLQSDQRYVTNYIHWRSHKGYGPLRIHSELKQKKIAADLIDSELYSTGYDWLLFAQDVWHKKRRQQKDSSPQTLQKLQRFLQYRGFSLDTIAQIERN